MGADTPLMYWGFYLFSFSKDTLVSSADLYIPSSPKKKSFVHQLWTSEFLGRRSLYSRHVQLNETS